MVLTALWPGYGAPAELETIRYAGVPGMSVIAEHLAVDLDPVLQCEVTTVARGGDGWRLAAGDGKKPGVFDVLILNAPAPQSSRLLEAFPRFAERIRFAKLVPCGAVMLEFDKPLNLPRDAALVANSPLS